MTQFTIDQLTELPDRIFVEIDHRFEVVVIRTKSGLELRIYPRTGGDLWDYPFAKLNVDEAEVIAQEIADGLLPATDRGGSR